ncbi:MAG TPA: glycosyltransferase [Verrucomicrobiae bacterium]|nr:glycosyltransferase [Verrucomicrobiae bacterium]
MTDYQLMNAEHPPKVSIIIPVLNAGGILENCLRSIRGQDYPSAAIELLVADGRSADNTREMAQSYGARLLDNPLRIAEQGKRIALAAASGDFIAFMDADNELSHPDFLRLAVEALQANPQALGVESYYPASPRMGSFCNYLNKTLHIGDPISWLMSVNPVFLGKTGKIERWGFPGERYAYPLGANGFIYRRGDLESVGASESFEDTQVALKLVLAGKREWLRIENRGVHHYLVKGLVDFIRKRRRQAYHHLSLRSRSPLSWTAQKPQATPLMACLYCATLIGPIYHTLRGLLVTRDVRWLWHPIACLASLVGLSWGVLTYLQSPKTADAEARLQPTQVLKRS